MYLEFPAEEIQARFNRAVTPDELDAALKAFHIEPIDAEAHRRPEDPDDWPTWTGALVFNSYGDPALWYRGMDEWPVRHETLRRLLTLLLGVPWPIEQVSGAIALWLDQHEGSWSVQVNDLGLSEEVRLAVDAVLTRG